MNTGRGMAAAPIPDAYPAPGDGVPTLETPSFRPRDHDEYLIRRSFPGQVHYPSLLSYRQSSFTAGSTQLDSPKLAPFCDHHIDPDAPPAHAFYEPRPSSPLSPDRYSSLAASVPNFFPPRKDRAKRYGHRFAFPVPFQQLPDPEGPIFRQSSAPSLGVDFRADDARLDDLGDPALVPSVASGAGFPSHKRFSTPAYSASDLSALDAAGGEPLLSRASSRQNASVASVASVASEGAEKPLPPGENNPHAYPGANLCFDYLNKG